MAIALVGGAVLGAACGELFGIVREELKTTSGFSSLLGSLQTTLSFVQPMIQELDHCDKLLGRPEEETKEIVELMSKGGVLVRKCSGINPLNYWKKNRLAKKLLKLDQVIGRYFQAYLPLTTARDNKKMFLEMKDMSKDIKRLSLTEGGGRRTGGFRSCAVPKAPEFVVGLDESLQELRRQLLTVGFSAIVVSAPGGFGKTTLVQKLCHDVEVKGKFRYNIFYVTVSQSPNLTAMVQNMILHSDNEIPDIPTEDEAVIHLQQLLLRIGEYPVLLVLEDVRPAAESLIEKFVNKRIPIYKIAVTSRFQIPSFSPPHLLNQLDHQNALKLFLQSAIPQVGMGTYAAAATPPDEVLVDKIVRLCNGVPLVLTVIGKSLCGRHPSIWESRLLKWSEGHPIINSDSSIRCCLEKSLDDLDGTPQYKDCFLDLGSFPKGHKIPAGALIYMWAELYELDQDGVHAMAILHELAARNLVDLVVSSKEENEISAANEDCYITQRDILRELAIHQNSKGSVLERKRLNLDIRGDNFPGWWSETATLHGFGARLLSISTDEMFSSKWPEMTFYALSEVEVLVLNFRTKSYALPNFLPDMPKLRVLILKNCGASMAELSNLELLAQIAPTLNGIWLERILIRGSLTVLNDLLKVSLFECKISPDNTSMVELPHKLANLRLLSISWSGDHAVDLSVLQPKALHLAHCYNIQNLPESLGKLKDLEILTIENCPKLKELPHSLSTILKLRLISLSGCPRLTDVPRICEFVNLCELNIRGCSGLSDLPTCVIKLKHLKKLFCDKETGASLENYKQQLPKLITVTE